MILPKSFYQLEDVCQVAQELLGKVLVTRSGKTTTSGIILETEAYCGLKDRACHAYPSKKTPRTEVFFEEGGLAYVYLCYGIHQLFNIIIGPKDVPQAILIRAIQPLDGESLMVRRRGGSKKASYDGPGKLTQGLAIAAADNKKPLYSKNRIWLEDRGFEPGKVGSSPRIGIDYAGEDALLPWRFLAQEIKKPVD